MKKLFLLLALTSASFSIFAQNRETGFEIGVSPEAGFPLGVFQSGYNAGFGLSGKFAYNFTPSSAITLQVGYLSFVAKENYPNYAYWAANTSFIPPPSGFVMVPIKAGYRYTLSNGIFFEPQVGLTALNGGNSAKFTFAVNAGFSIAPGLGFSAKFEDVTASKGSLPYIGLGLSYSHLFKHK